MALLAVLSGLSTIAFVLAPVQEHTATYSWSSSADGVAAALPLLPYQPMALDVTVPCSSLAAGTDGVVLSTYPLDSTNPAGLRLTKLGGTLAVSSDGSALADKIAVPAGCSRLTLSLTPDVSTVSIDGASTARFNGDHRPQLVGFFTTLASKDGPSATTTADTRFDSSPTVLKYLLGAAAVFFLVLALLGARREDRVGRTRPLPYTARGAGKPRISDAVVALVLFGWAVIGPSTVDDGYIMGILRGRGPSGFVGNYSHWFNAPEAPFGWFYEPYALWSDISPNPVWMRMPSVLIGIASWLVLSRLIAPRLFRRGTTLVVSVTLVAAFLVWWLPYNSGVRPEPLIAFGTAMTFVWVDRARVTHTLFPLCLAALTAGLTLGVGPTGVIAFGPFLIMLMPLLTWLRTRPGRLVSAGALAVLASLGLTLLVMCADQSLAALLAGNHVRTEIGPSLDWQEEFTRYDSLLNQSYVEGSLFRRLPVLASLAGAALLLLVSLRDRSIPGLNRRVGHLLTLSFLFCFIAIAFTPTKWTHHFGTFAVLGAAVLAGAVQTATVSANRSPARRAAIYAGAGGVFGLTLYGDNTWWYLSSLGVPFRSRPPTLHGIALSTPVLVLGLLLALGVLVIGTWRGAVTAEKGRGAARRCGTVLAVGLVLAITAELGSFVVVLRQRAGIYSIEKAGLSSLTGGSCALENALLVEPNKGAGVLGTGTDASSTNGFPPVAPGAPQAMWQSTSSGTSQLSTDWFALPPDARDGAVPLVITASGTSTPSSAITVELRTAAGDAPVRVPLAFSSTELTDLRVDVHAAAPKSTQVRVLATHNAEPGATPLRVSPPRVPVTTTLAAFTAGQTVATDWPGAF
ncbi:MAG: arabinosyltransferase domain-containing protein, partial [Mycobacteriaceae bacterium]